MTAISPELRLAAACAMWPPSDRRIENIRIAAASPIDWPRFLRVVRRHQVIGLVHDGLTRALPNVPLPISREISRLAATLVADNLSMAAEAVRLQRLFEEADLPVLFVKGASLAVLAFGSIGLRGSKDIDMLVPYERLPAAIEVLIAAGYQRFDPPLDISDAKLKMLMSLRKDLGFVKQPAGRRVELHWRLFLNPHAMTETSVMSTSRTVSLGGTAALRTLGEEDLFAYLCMHGALHSWHQLKWLADIGALLAAAPKESSQLFKQAAETRGVGRAAAQGMLLCRKLLDADLPMSLERDLNEAPMVRWLQVTAIRALTAGHGERTPHARPFGTTAGSLSAFFVTRSWRYCLAEFRNVLINETDVLMVPLPEPLRFLYPILRLPLWIWRQIGRRVS